MDCFKLFVGPLIRYYFSLIRHFIFDFNLSLDLFVMLIFLPLFFKFITIFKVLFIQNFITIIYYQFIKYPFYFFIFYILILYQHFKISLYSVSIFLFIIFFIAFLITFCFILLATQLLLYFSNFFILLIKFFHSGFILFCHSLSIFKGLILKISIQLVKPFFK